MYNYFKKHLKFSWTFSLFLFLSIVFSFFALTPILTIEGWMGNHEGLTWIGRANFYYESIKSLNFFPLWSLMDYDGAGSVAPLFYNKLFFYVVAIFRTFFLMKTSVVLSLALFMVIGSVGIYKTLSLFKLPDFSQVLIALSFPFLNYLFMDWLIRGAMTEFVAMCILPWFIYWNVNFLQNKKFSYLIIPIMFLIYLAHVIMIYYSSLILFISCGIFYFSNKSDKKLICQVLKKAILSVLVFIILVSPYFICSKLFLNESGYNVGPSLSFIKTEYFSPLKTYQTIGKYFFDTDFYKIFSQKYRLTFQLNSSIVVWLLVLSVLAIKSYKNGWVSYKNYNAVLLFLVLSISFCFYLMSSTLSPWFYKYVPGADFIQFSWRLLAFVSPLNLILIGFLLALVYKNNSEITNLLSIIFLLCVLFEYPGFREFESNYPKFSRMEMENGDYIGYPMGIGEYAPHFKKLEEITDPNEAVEYFTKDYAKKIERLNKQKYPCNLVQRFDDVGRAIIKYSVICQKSSLVKLPVHYSGYEEIYKIESESYEKLENYYRTQEDAFININLPKGQYILELRMPTMGRIFNKILRDNTNEKKL